MLDNQVKNDTHLLPFAYYVLNIVSYVFLLCYNGIYLLLFLNYEKNSGNVSCILCLCLVMHVKYFSIEKSILKVLYVDNFDIVFKLLNQNCK